MDINALIKTVVDTVSEASEILDWSLNEYGRFYKTFENIDFRNPPPKEDCPLVVISPGSKTGGLSQGVKTAGIGVDLLVYDDGKVEEDSGAFRFSGGRLVEEFRKLVFARIFAAINPTNYHIESVSVEYDAITQFPYVFAGMDIIITEEKLIGQNPYE